MQVTCYTVECALGLAKSKREKKEAMQAKCEAKLKKAERKQLVADKKRIRESKAKWWAEKATKICHLFIRTRDAGKGCKSCGIKEAIWHAGHYIPSHRGAALRYDERNIHLQCSACNDGSKLSGNLTLYRMALVRDYGEEYVQELERIGHTKKTWKIPELQEVIEYYKAKLKELR
jgi:hypothetical protein